MELSREVLSITSQDHLDDVLREYDISTEEWGLEDTKTSQDLYKELQEKEASLLLASGGLQKYIWTIKVDVFYSEEDRLYRLVEAVQHNHHTDTWRHRGLHNSLSEKRRALLGEAAVDAAFRGLEEELGVIDPFSLNQTRHKVWPVRMERNYAGLPIQTETDYFVAQLSPDEYRPEGYIERQPNKTTYFHWVNLL